MKTIIVAVSVLLTGLFKCNGSGKTAEFVPTGCSVEASVVDFTGLDGCGLMLELKDGTRLNPEKRVYIQAPKREDDPLYYFTLVAGEKGEDLLQRDRRYGRVYGRQKRIYYLYF